MAQNFWIAIFAFSTCFLVTIVVSLATAPKPEAELAGLVYGLTEVAARCRAPVVSAAGHPRLIVAVVLVMLNRCVSLNGGEPIRCSICDFPPGCSSPLTGWCSVVLGMFSPQPGPI